MESLLTEEVMKRSISGCLVLGLFLASLAGKSLAQDKVHTVDKGGLKIEGKVAADDPKVKIKPNPNAKFGIELPAKAYLVKLSAGKTYQIDMVSKQIDPFVVVQDDKGMQIAFDYDSGGDLNARLNMTPPKEGTYKVFAASLKGAGTFTLTIRDIGTVKVLEVGKGLKIEGKLGPGKASLVYHVKLVQKKTYVIDMLSPDQKALDPLLRLLDATGKVLASDDDSGEGLNARIYFEAPATGVFQIVATSFMNLGRGEFALQVKEKE
jgi:hypothetical protein